jgi:hypothetical protein
MENYQWLILGIMLAWTPSLIVLALFLARPYETDRRAKELPGQPH